VCPLRLLLPRDPRLLGQGHRLQALNGNRVCRHAEPIEAYRSITASEQLREIERIRDRADHDLAQFKHDAEKRGEQRGEQRAEAKWQAVVADKDAQIAELKAQLGKTTL